MRFREVVLVIILILAGLVVYQVQTGHWNLDFNWDDDFIGFGREFTYEETRTIDAPLPALLEVTNGQGWVEVRGGDQAKIELTFKKVIWRKTEEEAKDIAGRLKYSLTTAADRLTLATNRDEFRKRNFETGFILTVPRTMAVRVTNAYGVVRVEGVKEASVRNRHGELFASDIGGPCTLETSYEDLEAQDIQGECRLTNSHADVRAVSVAGDLWIETSYARIRVEDAGQKAELRGSNVDVDARRVRGAVSIETSYEKVFLSDVGPATVTARNSGITAENVRGDLDVRTSYEAVRASGVQGKFLVDAHNAPVSATGVGGSEISVKTSYDNIDLSEFSAEVTIVCRNGNVVDVGHDFARQPAVCWQFAPARHRILLPAQYTCRVERMREHRVAVRWLLERLPVQREAYRFTWAYKRFVEVVPQELYFVAKNCCLSMTDGGHGKRTTARPDLERWQLYRLTLGLDHKLRST